jgi:RNA ligase (TIGR02306 family)
MKLASIEKILSVEKHPNADKLDIVQVLGYKAIVNRDAWNVGDWCIFIQPDSVLPEENWSAFYRSKSNRVKAIRLRGSWSFGIVERLCNVGLGDMPKDMVIEGRDITEFLKITKYEPPAPQDLNASGPYCLGIPKTDEERYQNLQEIPYGELCDVTLKIDGQSWSAFCKLLDSNDLSGSIGIGGRSFLYKLDSVNNYTQNEKNYKVLDKLSKFCIEHNVNLCIRGEQYGKGIQAFDINPHAQRNLSLAFYSTWLIDEKRYARKGEPYYIFNIAKEMGLETVPILEKDVEITPELIKKYDEDLTTVLGVPFEGVVIQWRGGSFKIINKNYDSKK